MNPDFMDRAIELSRQGMNAGEGGPFGAVIACGGEIIAEANNKVLATGDPTNHAEMIAIRAAASKLGRGDLSDCEFYSNSEPCPMCLGAIYWARLGTVYFANTKDEAADIGFDDARIYDELITPAPQRSVDFIHVPDTEAREIFAEWMNKDDRSQY